MKAKRGFALIFLYFISCFGVSMTAPPWVADARAMSPTVKKILVSGLIGAAAGTLVGVVTYPLHQEVRGIFLGTSIGLYTGMALGGVQAMGVGEVKRGLTPPQYGLALQIFEF